MKSIYAIIITVIFITFARQALAQNGIQQIDSYCVVSAAVWTDGINDLNHKSTFSDTFKGEKVFVWLKIKGGRESLEYIKSHKKLPLKLEWYTYYGYHFDKDTYRDKEIELSDKDIKGLEDEYNDLKRGYWDYRIWDHREKHGYWRVIPRIINGKQMTMENSTNKCSLEIIFE